jgi:hypothetical protein
MIDNDEPKMNVSQDIPSESFYRISRRRMITFTSGLLLLPTFEKSRLLKKIFGLDTLAFAADHQVNVQDIQDSCPPLNTNEPCYMCAVSLQTNFGSIPLATFNAYLHEFGFAEFGSVTALTNKNSACRKEQQEEDKPCEKISNSDPQKLYKIVTSYVACLSGIPIDPQELGLEHLTDILIDYLEEHD